MAEVQNTASVSYTYAGASGSPRAVSNTSQTQVNEATSVSITKLAQASGYMPGQNLTFDIRVQNTGSTELTGVTVSDNLGSYQPSGDLPRVVPLVYISGTAFTSVNNQFMNAIVPTSTNPLNFSLGTLQPGDIVDISYTARAPEGTTLPSITNTATVNATFNATPATDSSSATVMLADFAMLQITKNGSAETITTGQPFSYTLTIANNGNAEATDVSITDQLPANFSVSSISSTQNGASTTLQAEDYTLVGTLLTVPSGTSALKYDIAPHSTSPNSDLVLTISGQFVEQ